jgi:multidrug efflux pump subunit AcrA (membrane-fusion protein)
MKIEIRAKAAVLAACIPIAIGILATGCGREDDPPPPATTDSPSPSTNSGPAVVELTKDQLSAIKIGTVATFAFPVEKTGIGGIDFQNNLYSDSSLSTSVFPPVTGTISQMLVELGDPVKKGQPLYAIQSGTTNVTVRSPITGQISAVNASIGLPVEPNTSPAPCTVADVSIKWLLANVPEGDIPSYHPGQPVKATVVAYPDRVFEGTVSKIYPDADANTHRFSVRCRLSDKGNVLRAGMLANYVLTVQKPVHSLAVPANGIVREGDGTMTAWVTTDRTHFTQKVVKIGLREHGMVQILDGLSPGELVVTDGAIFLDNMLQAPVDD